MFSQNPTDPKCRCLYSLALCTVLEVLEEALYKYVLAAFPAYRGRESQMRQTVEGQLKPSPAPQHGMC